MDLKNFIKISSAFGVFSDTDVTALADAMVVTEVPENHIFTSQGEPGDAFYLLMEGGIEVTETDVVTGVTKDPKILRVGEVFGLLSLLDDMPAEATTRAISPVTVASLKRDAFKVLDMSNNSLGLAFQFVLASQLARDLQKVNASARALLKHNAA